MTAVLMGQELIMRAEALARACHEGQTDKGGAPYWLHLQRVADRVADLSPEIQATAWLHDAVEDTDLTLRVLCESGFDSVVVSAVQLLTHGHEPYETYVDRICMAAEVSAAGLAALRVKEADLLDNMDPRRKVPTDEAFYERSMLKHWRALNRIATGRWPL